MQLLIQLHSLGALRFKLLYLVAKLDALKMLPGVKQQARRERRPKRTHAKEFAHARGRSRACQARIVDAFYCVIFGHAMLISSPLREDNFSATRIFALRARGLVRISSSPGW